MKNYKASRRKEDKIYIILGSGDYFLDTTPKTIQERKNYKWNFIKNKNLCSVKDTLREWEDTS